MEELITALENIKKINNAYALSNDAIDNGIKKMSEAKVCTPIIGKFSTGKSAVINTLLGYSRKLLTEDITPQTAVPTEIFYSEKEQAIVFNNDGSQQVIEMEEYREKEFAADKIRCVRLGLKNSFLEEIQDVMLVDMPGFESGYDIHNKAIDNYLPESLAYMVAFAADDMTLRSSIGNILKELCLHNMPICIVITKQDKADADTYSACINNLKENLKRLIGNRELEYCITCSAEGNAKDLKNFLYKVQEDSQKILFNRYKELVVNAAGITESYLETCLKNNDLTESELSEKEDKLNDEMKKIDEKVKKEGANFNEQIDDCVREIKADVRTALNADESTFIAMIQNSQDIREQVNVIVRSATTSAIQKHFVPRVQKYLGKISDCIDVNVFADMGFATNELNVASNNIVGKLALSGVAGLGSMLFLGTLGPIGAGIAAVVGIISILSGGSGQESRKREEERMKIKQKLYGTFQDICNQVEMNVKTELTKQIIMINKTIEEEISSQRSVLEKAMSDLKEQMLNEQQARENYIENIKQDLIRIGGIKDGLR